MTSLSLPGFRPAGSGLAVRGWGFPAARVRAEGAIQGKDKVVAGLQCVRQNGLGRAGLAESGGHDQGSVPARLVPGRDENTSAGSLHAARLETDNFVLAEQRVGV